MAGISITKRFKKWKKKYRQMKQKVKKGLLRKKKYIGYINKYPVDEKAILLESQHGGSIGGNIFALLRELCENPRYSEYKIYLSCFNGLLKSRRAFLRQYGLEERVQLVSTAKAGYFKILATVKYLINDNTFTYAFIKRPEQVYLNTWHGTPLKTLGKRIKNDYGTIGNAQRNFYMADYLLYPNEFTMEHMLEDYMISNMGKAKILLTGYPRNTVFLSEGRSKEIRREYGIEGLEVFAYLPTWRGKLGNITSAQQNEILYEYLKELDEKLAENQRVYVKLHPISVKSIDLSGFKKVLPFPTDKYETYEFLNATDGLITDYSSIFFDYAVTKKKIILFTYDKEEYTADRGFYFSMDELPFPQTNTVDDLLKCMNAPKSYDDTEFLKKFCPYEKERVTDALLQRFLFDEKSSLIKEEKVPDNGRKNILIYAGGFGKNGITTSVLNLLRRVDKEKYNFTVLFKIADLKKHQESLLDLPAEVCHYGYYESRSVSVKNAILYKLWADWGWISYKKARMAILQQSQNEIQRLFTGCRIDKVIQFNGYVNGMIEMLGEMPCSRTIFVHNDMEQEISTKGNVNLDILSRAYQNYDSVAVVTPDLIESTKRIAAHWKGEGSTGTANIVVVRNVIDYKKVLSLGAKPFVEDEKTRCNVEMEEVKAALASKGKKFVTVGRFSEEKGHDRLIEAFEKVLKDYPDCYLFIVGGYGKLFNKTKEKVEELGLNDRIFVIRYLTNPYALVKQCDYFALSSFYEGFGLVLAEADILGVPCFSTDITGPKKFMEQYGGLLVEDSTKGVEDGLRACLTGRVPKKLNVDYEEYNKEAIAQFESLL